MGKVYTRFLSCVADPKREGGGGGKKALSPQSLSLFPFLPIPSRRLGALAATLPEAGSGIQTLLSFPGATGGRALL